MRIGSSTDISPQNRTRDTNIPSDDQGPLESIIEPLHNIASSQPQITSGMGLLFLGFVSSVFQKGARIFLPVFTIPGLGLILSKVLRNTRLADANHDDGSIKAKPPEEKPTRRILNFGTLPARFRKPRLQFVGSNDGPKSA